MGKVADNLRNRLTQAGVPRSIADAQVDAVNELEKIANRADRKAKDAGKEAEAAQDAATEPDPQETGSDDADSDVDAIFGPNPTE